MNRVSTGMRIMGPPAVPLAVGEEMNSSELLIAHRKWTCLVELKTDELCELRNE